MTTELENNLSRELRAALAPLSTGEQIPECAELREALLLLEGYLPHVRRAVHADWEFESLDGLLPHVGAR